MSVPDELSLVHWEVLEQQRCQVTIFTEVEKVLHMQCVDTVLLVVLDDLVADEEWLVGVRSAQTVKRETTRQTSDGTEQGLERLGHMVGDEVLVDLHHRDDGLLGIRKLGFTTNAEELLVVNHTEIKLSINAIYETTETYAEISRFRESGATVVSASTMNTYS